MKSPVFAITLILALVSLSSISPSQELTLCPPNAVWLTAHSDCMFDIENKSNLPMTIKHFGLSGGGTLEIFRTTSANSFQGVEFIPSAWTQVGGIFDRGLLTGLACAFSPICTPEQNIALAPGQKMGIYIRNVFFIPAFGVFATNQTTGSHRVWREDTNVAIHTGIISTPQFGVGIGGIWEIPMAVIYTLGDADLSATYSMQAPEGLTLSLNNFAPTATLGFTLVSTDTALPVGTGPVLGLFPDANTFSLLTTPYSPGNPLHFHPADTGLFPNTPWFASQQELVGLSGLSLDLVSIFLDAQGTLVDQSQVQRVAIP